MIENNEVLLLNRAFPSSAINSHKYYDFYVLWYEWSEIDHNSGVGLGSRVN